MYPSPYQRMEQSCPVFHRKYQMEIYGCVCIGHDQTLIRCALYPWSHITVCLLLEDVDVFGGALHVVVLADYALHGLDISVEGAVERFVI